MPDPSTTDPDEARQRRRLKFRARDDYAVELFQEALGKLGDVARIERILVELGRFYNPYLDEPIVSVATGREVLEALSRGDVELARARLVERLRVYARDDDAREA